MSDDNKKLQIVSGDGEDLNISPVYRHLHTAKPNCNNKPKYIVIPKAKKSKKNNKKNNKS